MTARRALAALIALGVLAAACGDDDGAITTVTTAPPRETTAATAAPPTSAATTTAPPPTTTVPPTTTTGTTSPPPTITTTTAPPFDGDTGPEQAGESGAPSPNLVDVRTGAHAGFTRVVWEMDGDSGTPAYQVAYADPPFANVGDITVPVDGSAFLRVIFFPGTRYDISGVEPVQTYFGPDTIDVGIGSVVQVVFVEDFEANMEWVIGLTGERPFHVFTLENPTRLVVDVAG